MAMDYIITPAEIFKFTTGDHDEIEPVIALKNAKHFISRVGVDIFFDEYSVLYKVLETSVEFDRVLTEEIIAQVMESNRDFFLNSPRITIGEDIKDEKTRFEYITDLVMREYFDLTEIPILEGTFKGNIELYIGTWYNNQYEEMLLKTQDIALEGATVGRKFLKGAEDADYYYQKTRAFLKDIKDSNMELLTEVIDTSVMDSSQVKQVLEDSEKNSEPLAYTGIDSLDEDMMGLRPGEMYVIQAGSGVGKTRMAGSWAKQVINNGKNVLFVSLEQKPSRIYNMFLSRHILDTFGSLAISDRDLNYGTYDLDLEPLVQEASADLVDNPKTGNLRIEFRALNAMDVPLFLETIYEEFPFDFLVFDYFGLLQTSKDRYLELTYVVNYLKNVCKTFKGKGFCPVLPNQLSREGSKALNEGKEDEVKEAGSETLYLLRAADNTITLHQNSEMKKDNEMDIIFSKMRLGSTKSKITVHAEHGKLLYKDIEVDEDDEEFWD